MQKLTRDFFEQPTLDVARQLIGKKIVYQGITGIITETEAYISGVDAACHASRGRTKRTEVLFGNAGFSYVYFIYGMYHCLNFVTGKEGFASGVLIRGAFFPGVDFKKTNGPGKLCKFLNITRAQNAIDLIANDDLYVLDSEVNLEFETTPRIGIKQAIDYPWRFVVKKSELSKLKDNTGT
jgi:DNA-3-methyladenine glycosylase